MPSRKDEPTTLYSLHLTAEERRQLEAICQTRGVTKAGQVRVWIARAYGDMRRKSK